MVKVEPISAEVKEAWGPGPWQSEPDDLVWMEGDLRCQIVRHPVMGHLCGYVLIPPTNPWARVKEAPDVRMGITADRRVDGARLIGWDHAHYMDFIPGLAAVIRKPSPLMPAPTAYKTFDYAKERMAELVKALQCDWPVIEDEELEYE